jgi:hypothetical protein
MLDLIDPDGVTIIDYLEIDTDFSKVAGPLRQIFDRLDGGVALIGLQKDPDVKWNRGKSFSLEKPRISLSLDYDQGKGLHHLCFLKAKARANSEINPREVELWFDIADGARFLLKKKKLSGRAQ